MKYILLISLLLFIGCTPIEVNTFYNTQINNNTLCELYANSENVTFLLPEREYVINDIKFTEQELIDDCKKKD